MSQDNLNNKIKKVFESMDEYDQGEACKRKEDIWKEIDSTKDKKPDRQWLLILLLGSLFFAAGWLAKHTQIIHANSKNQEDKIQQANFNQFASASAEAQPGIIQQELDSLNEVNRSLSVKLAALNDKPTAIIGTETKTIINYIRDTLYLTEVKIQEQIVERIIKDTILIEVPVIQENQSAIAELSVNESKKKDSDDRIANKTERPSSIQFNFSNTNLKDR